MLVKREESTNNNQERREVEKEEDSLSGEEAKSIGEEKGEAPNPYRNIIQAIQTNLEVQKELEESEATDSSGDTDKESEARTATPKNMTGKEGAE